MGAAVSSQHYDGPSSCAAKLAAGQPTILAFLSPSCGLCASLRPMLDRVSTNTINGGSSSSTSGIHSIRSNGGSGDTAGGTLQVAVLNAQLDKQWAPEMLAYTVEAVPCFVLLGPDGRAVCKTPAPRSRQQMEAALQEMVQHADSLHKQ